MLTYDLEGRGQSALYEYLYRCIREDVLAGRLAAGEKMPSKRSLARHLQVGVVTVENAYAQLVAEGYLYAREKRGYYVNRIDPRLPVPPAPPRREAPPPEQSWLLDLKSGGGGTEGFPFSVWARLLRGVLSDGGADLMRATPHNGAPELRRAIAGHLYRFRGLSVSPEQIVVGAGSEYLYNMAVQLLGQDRVYGVEDPGYPKAAKIYRLNGARCRAVPIDGRGLPPEALAHSDVQVMHLSPSHQFPTGAVLPIARRQALLRWAREGEGRYLIEDDYDSEFRFAGRPIPSLQSIDTAGRVLYMNTFSRSLAPSLRLSYMVLPEALLETFRRRLGFYACPSPAIEQYALARFLSQGYFEQHINRMRGFYRNRRDQVISAIQQSPLAGRCRIWGQEGGLHFLLRLETERSDWDLARGAEAQGLRLAFLSDYAQRTGQPHVLVVRYPGVDPETLPLALERLAALLGER